MTVRDIPSAKFQWPMLPGLSEFSLKVGLFSRHRIFCLENPAGNRSRSQQHVSALTEDPAMTKTTNRRLQFIISILVSMAVLACFAPAVKSQSEEPEGRLIAPRRLHPRLQREGKLPKQTEGAARNQMAPSDLESPRSPPTDNLGIAKGFAGIAFPNSFGSVPPDTILQPSNRQTPLHSGSLSFLCSRWSRKIRF